MPVSTQNILIFGATGLVGKHIANSILADASNYKKIGVFTSQDTIDNKADAIASLKSRGAEIIVGDITSDNDVNAALKGFDTVVSCVGRPVIHMQIKLIELMAKHPDVKRFFPSEYGTDIEYGPESVNEKPHQQKIKVRAALKDTDLEYTYVVTGPYGDADRGLFLSAVPPEREANGTFNVAEKHAVLTGDGDNKISLTTMRDVGKFVAAALKRPDAVLNRAIKVNSFTATGKEIVAEFERQTGGSWKVGYTSLEVLKERENKAYEEGVPWAGPLTLRRIWTEGGTLYAKRDNGVVGLEEGVDSLESAVRQAIEVQKGY